MNNQPKQENNAPNEYSRAVFFYETDKMGVVHHSNYVRWMEEAREHFYNSVDLAYVVTETYGIMCPTTEVAIKYKLPAKYGDTFTIKSKLTKYTGVRFRMSYSIINQDGAVLAEAETEHAFIDKTLRPVSMAKTIPDRHEKMKNLLAQAQT